MYVYVWGGGRIQYGVLMSEKMVSSFLWINLMKRIEKINFSISSDGFVTLLIDRILYQTFWSFAIALHSKYFVAFQVILNSLILLVVEQFLDFSNCSIGLLLILGGFSNLFLGYFFSRFQFAPFSGLFSGSIIAVP